MIGSVYTYGDACQCMFITSLKDQCMIEEREVVEALSYVTKNMLSYVCYFASILILEIVDCDCHRDEVAWMSCIVSSKEVNTWIYRFQSGICIIQTIYRLVFVLQRNICQTTI